MGCYSATMSSAWVSRASALGNYAGLSQILDETIIVDGIGREGAQQGLEEYLETKYVSMDIG